MKYTEREGCAETLDMKANAIRQRLKDTTAKVSGAISCDACVLSDAHRKVRADDGQHLPDASRRSQLATASIQAHDLATAVVGGISDVQYLRVKTLNAPPDEASRQDTVRALVASILTIKAPHTLRGVVTSKRDDCDLNAEAIRFVEWQLYAGLCKE